MILACPHSFIWGGHECIYSFGGELVVHMDLGAWEEVIRVKHNHWLEVKFYEWFLFMERHSRNPRYFLGVFLLGKRRGRRKGWICNLTKAMWHSEGRLWAFCAPQTLSEKKPCLVPHFLQSLEGYLDNSRPWPRLVGPKRVAGKRHPMGISKQPKLLQTL